MASYVDIIIRTVDESKSKGLKASFTEINQAVELLRKGLEAVKKLYDFSKEGAEIDFTREKFNRLAESIGTTGDVLIGKLKTATQGIYSDLDLMANATDMVGLGLANTSDEAVRLATVAAGLNMNMNQLTLTLTNKTTMRFDALGVRVNGFKERLEKLEEQGYSTDAAFQEAFLQQAEEQLGLVGNAADSTLGSYMKLEGGVKDLTATWKEQSAKALEPLVKVLGDALERSSRYETAVRISGVTYKDFNAIAKELNLTQEEYVDFVLRSTEATNENTKAVELSKEQIGELTKANQEWLDLIGTVSSEYKTQADRINDINEERADIEGQMQADLAAGWWEGSERIQGYKDKLAELDDKESEYTANFEENKNKRVLAMLEEELSKDGLTEEETQYLEDLGVAWGIYTQEAIDSARDTRTEVQDLVDQFNNMPTEKVVTVTTYHVDNYLQSTGSRALDRGYASGTDGWETVPPGYPNDSYTIGLTSGEPFYVGKSGTSPEDAPRAAGVDKDTIRQVIREEMSNIEGGVMRVEMPVYLDGQKIYENQKRISTRRGSSLIKSGVT